MSVTKTLLILPGDGIGPEIVAQAVKVIDALIGRFDLALDLEDGLIGGAAFEATGEPLPEVTLARARQIDAVLLGAVGGPAWDHVARDLRPETGLLKIRAGLDLFGNLRPVRVFAELVAASTLRPEVIADLDIVIVRELTGGIYFGQPRGIDALPDNQRRGYNTMVYLESEIRRIAVLAFEAAMQRELRVCSVDKANVLEVSQLWREVVIEVAQDYPEVELSHMYVDNAAMQLVRDPRQFDVLLTPNMFGDILSDLASMLTGSIGMLPSASLNSAGQGMYEPIHGSAPDIAGTDKANPLATILSLAMCLRSSLGESAQAARVEAAVEIVLREGWRTPDIFSEGMRKTGTEGMGDAVVAALS